MSLAKNDPTRFRERDPIEYFYVLDNSGEAVNVICVRGYGVDDNSLSRDAFRKGVTGGTLYQRCTKAEYESFKTFNDLV